MLTYTIAEYILWRQGLDLRANTIAEYILWRQGLDLRARFKPPPQWEDSAEVDRLMRSKPEKGGTLFA